MALTRIGNQAISLDAAEIPNLDASKIQSGVLADARISASSVSQHAQSFDDNKIVNDISTLALRQASNENKTAYNTNSMYVDVFQDSSGITNLTNAARDNLEYISSVVSQGGVVHSGFNGSRGYDGNDHPTGGGAGAAGNAVQLTSNTSLQQPNGGDGMSTDITCSTIYFGGGGGGAAHSGGQGGSGGSGIVIVRFATSSQASYSKSGGTASTIGSDTMIQWLSGSGSFTPNANGTGRVLIVGGGGSAGAALSGAGGGGEVIEYTNFQFVGGTTYNISVAGTTAGAAGAGSNGGSDGASSSFGSQTAKGGGKGYARDTDQSQSDKPNQGGAGADNTRNISDVIHDANDKSSLAYANSLSATGSFENNAITAPSSINKMGAVITYQNQAGTNALNTDIVLKLSADGGSNYATATLTAMPDFASGIKMAKVNDLTIANAGTSLKYKLEFANQTGSKEARIRGVSLQY